MTLLFLSCDRWDLVASTISPIAIYSVVLRATYEDLLGMRAMVRGDLVFKEWETQSEPSAAIY